MIIPEYKTVFVHVPKAAGQSVENFLLHSLGKDRHTHGGHYLLRPNQDPTQGPKRLAHLTATEYTKYGYLSEAEYAAYYTFSIIRNPWSRMVSFYKFRGFSSLVTFNTFVRYYLPEYIEKEHWFFRPQTDFIYDTNEKLAVDFVGRMEQLNTDFEQVANRLNIPFTELPRSNHSEEKGLLSRKSFNLFKKHPGIVSRLNFESQNLKDYRALYSSESKKTVQKYYEKDTDLLNYIF